MEWLRQHLVAVVEIKRQDGREIDKVFNTQVKPALKESDAPYVLGVLYDKGRLYLFQRKNGKVLRYDESLNLKKR